MDYWNVQILSPQTGRKFRQSFCRGFFSFPSFFYFVRNFFYFLSSFSLLKYSTMINEYRLKKEATIKMIRHYTLQQESIPLMHNITLDDAEIFYEHYEEYIDYCNGELLLLEANHILNNL